MPTGDDTIAFGVFDTPFGSALPAATPRGLCCLRLCAPEEAPTQVDILRTDFPHARVVEDPASVQSYAFLLTAFLGARTDRFDPMLEIVLGTPFQREVWAVLQTVPAGETITYTELAARVGRPSAVRAVAGACARNGIAIAVPCHRVVRSDGSLSGYRWGEARKQKLLNLEAGR